MLTRRLIQLTFAVSCCSLACFPFQHKEQALAPDPGDDDKQPEKEYEAKQTDLGGGFPEASKLLAVALPAWATKLGTPPPTVLRTYLVDTDWGMERANNGVITGRATRVNVYYKGGESGKCLGSLCGLQQEEQGGKWGKPSLICYVGRTTRVTCASVEKLPPSSP